MGTAHPGEDPNSMTDKSMSDKPTTSQFTFGTDDRSEARRRLHLRDITNELPDAGDDRAGADLRVARERRGEDMRAIAMSLRIRREQLEALEESRYDDLPGRAYAVGFVRSYAEYLGLDSAHIVERYKAELDLHLAAPGAIHFPEVQEQVRLPRGTFLIIALIIGVGAYGAYLMTRSADKLMAERAPAAPALAEAQTANPQAPDVRRGLSGDPASAATRAENDVTALQLLGDGAPDTDPSSVYAVPPVVEAGPTDAAPEQLALLTSPAATGDMSAPAVGADAPAAIAGLPEVPQGAAFGIENTDARVVVRARKPDAWIRIEDAQGHVLIERTLQVGDTYAVPNAPGSILVARDASAFELVVDNASLGLAGPPTLVLTGKPLDPTAILAAMPRPVPTPAEEAAALAPEAVTTR